VEGKRAVAAQVDAACRDFGFLQVTGHGVPGPVCDDLLSAWAAFFDLPMAEKMRWMVPDESANRGYSWPGKEALAHSRGEQTPPDLMEAFNVGRREQDDPYYERHGAFYAPTVWPDRPRGLREIWERYDLAASAVADTVLRAMALALDLPESWFTGRCARAIETTRAINYQREAGAAEPEPGQMRMGAHTDYGILTVLLADDVPGLQVFRAGGWQDTPTPRGTLTPQHRGHAGVVDQRPVDVHAAPGAPAPRRGPGPGAPAVGRPLPGLRARPGHRVHPVLLRAREPAQVRAGPGR
jgi:isopenicillin N synthase-like dioxygenase